MVKFDVITERTTVIFQHPFLDDCAKITASYNRFHSYRMSFICQFNHYLTHNNNEQKHTAEINKKLKMKEKLKNRLESTINFFLFPKHYVRKKLHIKRV